MLLLLGCVSCGDDVGDTNDTSSDSSLDTSAEEKDEYVFPEVDYEGDDMVFLSRSNSEMYNKIEIETMTGDILDDATYDRNALIEEKFNVNIVQIDDIDVIEAIKTSVASGDDDYQVAFPLTANMGALILEGMFHDLSEGEGFQFDQPWWDQSVMEDVYLGDNKAVYFANSDLSLLNFEATWCMYFNRRMLDDLQLETPYQTVRDGKWTFDKLYEYTSAAANLNGDESFSWNKDGKCVYGYTSMGDFLIQAYVCSNEKQIKFIDGQPQLMVGSSKFYDLSDKLTNLFGEKGTNFFSNDRTNGSHYESVFASSRALFCGCEIKGGDGAGKFAEMNDDYGIVPMPKYDEDQENYISPIAVWTYFLTVPITNDRLYETSVILDAMSYLSYRDIVPKYYEVVLQVKHVRDEETPEMLDIIRETRTYYTAYAFGWGKGLRDALTNSIMNGTGGAASIVATYKDQVVTEMENAMSVYNNK